MAYDVQANRRAQKWTLSEQAGRVLWSLAAPFFQWSPRPFWAWRRLLLTAFGAEIGPRVRVHPSVKITIPWNLQLSADVGIGDRVTLYALGPIRIGQRASISQGAHICAGTHDYTSPAMTLLKPPIEIGAECWICADAFVGPGVRIGARAIVAARAVVVKDVPAGAIVVGNPARHVKWRDVDPDGAAAPPRT